MTIDRRVFVGGAALVVLMPTLRVLPADAVMATLDDIIQPVFMISGWSPQDNTNPDNRVWMSVGHGWRAAWR